MPRVMEITTPLGEDVLLFHRLHAAEEMSRLSEYSVALLSKKGDIKTDDILGKSVTIKLELPENKIRYFNGYVTRFSQTGMHGKYHSYHAMVRPWLWFLTRTADCRIFQKKKVPDIIKDVFADHPDIANFESELTASYSTWEYCVQYRETDFNFVSRLMEQEGISYYFKHTDGKHTLVLTDSNSQHVPYPGFEKVPFIPIATAARLKQERVVQWSYAREIQSGAFVVDDFDFEKPSTELQVNAKTAERKHAFADYEIYDYPGEYLTSGDGNHYIRARMEEMQANYDVCNGSGNARGLCSGYTFNLTEHPRSDQNAEYLLVSTVINMEYSQYEAMEAAGTHFDCVFTALNSREPFRPARTTPKPIVHGPQTAIVVGPKGDEIYTDKYSRVKVQFHWDRYGKRDQDSSCWIRVASTWAGKNWGFISIPRIGQEVVVDFLEGDMDQPLITGRVYNAEQMPPWDLPANMTQSGVLSRSTKTGSPANANAIRFEDKIGAEQLWIHAEKNQDIEVENDETHWVGHDRKKTIDHDETTLVKHDRTETVGNNETITIGVNRTEKVGANESITIGANRTEMVAIAETVTIGATRTHTIGGAEALTVGGARAHTVGGAEAITVGGAQAISVGAAQAITVGGVQKVDVGGNQSTSVGGNGSSSTAGTVSTEIGKAESRSVGEGRSTTIGKDDALKVGKNLVIEAGDSVTIKTGDASITMKKDGTIVIKGKDIAVDGSGKIYLKASSDVVIKGSKVLQN